MAKEIGKECQEFIKDTSKQLKAELIKQLKTELEFKAKQLEDAQKALYGTIEATGSLNTIYTREGVRYKWDINVSDILTKLIKEVGRLCEDYASDLFVQWKYNIADKLDDGTLRSTTEIFAIRESGVDHKEWYEIRKNDNGCNYYREVWFLDIETTETQIKMVLHKQEE